jgi:quercetin dioxygenase-like cupin family protein
MGVWTVGSDQIIEKEAAMDKYINKILDLAKEVRYSKDCVTSKIIYKGPNVILTLFALAKGQSIAEHITPFDALVQVLEGTAELVIGGRKRTVKAGQSIIMPAKVPHALYAVDNYKMLLTMMK